MRRREESRGGGVTLWGGALARFVTEFSSLFPCHNDIDHNLAHIDDYVKDDVRDTPLMLAPARTLVRYEPLGVALIFGSWNYPYVVNLNPLS